MHWFFRLPGTQAPLLRLERSPWIGRARLYANGREVTRSRAKGRPFVIQLGDATTREVFVKPRTLDNVPTVIFEGERIELDRDLAWYEWVVCGLPIVLVFIGGALGGGIGGAGVILNQQVLRSNSSAVGKVLGVGAVTLGSIASFVIAAVIMRVMFNALWPR